MKIKILNSALGIFLILVIGSCQKEEKEPKNNFTIGNTLLHVFEPLDIQNKSDSISVSYKWDFGDGIASDQRSPSHFYQSPGEYSISLTLTGKSGSQSKVLQQVKVGERYINEIVLNSFSLKKYYKKNEFWDNDSTGIQTNPDLFVVLNDKTGNPLYKSEVVYNVKTSNLPLSFKIPDVKISPYLDYEMGINSFQFYLLDKDKNGQDTIMSSLMSGASGNNFKYDKVSHSGQFDINLFANYTVKFTFK